MAPRHGDAGGRHDIAKSMNPPTQTGARTQQARNGASRPRRGVAAPAACSRTSSSTSGSSSARSMDDAIEKAHRPDRRPSACCSTQGAITDDQLARAVAERFGLDHVDLAQLPRRPRRGQARHPGRGQALPGRARLVRLGDRTLLVAMADPANVLAVDDIAVMTGYEVRPAVASSDGHRAAARAARGPRLRPPALLDLDERRGGRGPRRRRGRAGRRAAPLYDIREQDAPIDFGSAGEDASVIQLVHRVIKEAVERGVSDIHFEPQRRRDARPLPHRRRAAGGRDRPRAPRSRPSSRA